MSSRPDRASLAMDDFSAFHSGGLQARSQNLGIDGRCHRDDLGLPAPYLLESSVHILSRRESDDLKKLRIGFDHAQRAATNRASRSQDGNTFHEQKIGWGAARGAAYCITRQTA